MSLPDDPERLANAAPRSPLGELLASAARDLPSDEQLARLAAQLGPVLDSAPNVPSDSTAPTGVSGLVKLGLVAGALAALVGAGLALRRSSHSAAVAPAATAKVQTPVVDALPVPETSVSAPPLAIEPAPKGDDSSSSAPEKSGAASSKSAPAAGKAASESALLEQARRALNSSPSYALQLANQHRARFPNGVLTQEREVIAIEALRRLHRGNEADQRAAGFSKAFPGSAHQRRIEEVAPK